uniref:Secreted protein n=1 Tax=Amblyomma tuberculatum TaxID=48802 RepID=A0A6M2E261_9ACAR
MRCPALSLCLFAGKAALASRVTLNNAHRRRHASGRARLNSLGCIMACLQSFFLHRRKEKKMFVVRKDGWLAASCRDRSRAFFSPPQFFIARLLFRVNVPRSLVAGVGVSCLGCVCAPRRVARE